MSLSLVYLVHCYDTLEKMRAFYTEKGIDILKDAVSLPGVSLHYLLRGTIERGAELWTPSKEAYDMLKGAMVGGPSIVFKRFHEAGVTQIRLHRLRKTKTCRRIIGYDANALYLSTMLRDMPGGKGEVVHYDNLQEGLERVKDNKWFVFAEVDIEIPQKLWMKFEEMPPFFFTSRATAHERLHGMHREKKRRRKKAGWWAVSEKAAAVCTTDAVVRESQCCDHGGVPHYRLPTNKSVEVVRWWGDRCAPHQRRRQEQSAVSRHLQTARKQQLRENDRGGGKAHIHGLHERREAGGPDAEKRVFWKTWTRLGARTSWRAESRVWRSRGHSRSASRCTSWRSCVCSSFTMTSWTGTPADAITSWSRWTRTVTTWRYLVISWKTSFAQRCVQNLS